MAQQQTNKATRGQAGRQASKKRVVSVRGVDLRTGRRPEPHRGGIAIAWGVSPRSKRNKFSSPRMRATERYRENANKFRGTRYRPFHGLQNSIAFSSWGLRPGLYAYACFAG